MPTTYTPEQRQTIIARLRRFPDEWEKLVAGLSEHELYTAFIPNEWSVAQNVHHVPDSHMNAFIRVRLILTEDKPTVKPYDQDAWAKLADYKLPIEPSLSILRNLHVRWCALLDSLTAADFARVGIHPEIGEITIDDILKIYNEHCDAHIEQVTRTIAAGRK